MNYVSMSTIAAGSGLLFGLVKYFDYIHNICTSNTTLIIRQNEQVCFLLQRVIALNKKINKLELELNTYTFVKDLQIDEKVPSPSPVEVSSPSPSEVPVEVFELIEATCHVNTDSNNKKGWFQTLF